MANAVILYGGLVVESTNLTEAVFHYKSGFVMSFVLKGFKYTYSFPGDFRTEDQGSNLADGGYYQESGMLNYLAKKLPLTSLNAYALKISDLNFAVKGDIIVSHTLYLIAPYTDFCKFSNYTWTYDPTVDIIDDDGNIIFPSGTPPTVPVTLNTNAGQFYILNISLVTSDDFTDDKDQGAYNLALCALEINMINRDIFPIFSDSQELIPYINSQNLEWAAGSIFIKPSLADIQQYYYNLKSFYVAAYSYQVLIINAPPDTKIFWLANVLSVSGLSVFPVDDKINILNQAINTQMVSSTLNDEDFLVKVVSSVNLVPAQINDFLGRLLIDKFYDNDDNQLTLFEAIYNNVADNRTGRYTLGLYNLPPDRKLYIQALYNLWLSSKYCPYFDDPSYTEPADSLGFFPESYFMTESGAQNYGPDKAPPVLIYSATDTSLGYYLNSFRLFINDSFITVNKITSKTHVKDDSPHLPTSTLYGSYLLLQPVTIVGYLSDLDLAIPQICYIPIFYLYYADSYKTIKDFDFSVLLIRDVVLTYELFDLEKSISYIKGLSGLYDLSNAQKVILIWQAAEGVSTALQFTVGEAAALSDYIKEVSTDTDIIKFQQTIDKFLFVLTLATVSADILTKQQLMVAADNVITEQQALISAGKPVNLPQTVIDAVSAIADNKSMLNNLMYSKVSNLQLNEVLPRFNVFDSTQQFNFFRNFFNLNDISSWDELNALKPINNSSDTYNLVDIWDQDITETNVNRANIDFLNGYGYEIYQEKDVWEHIDLIKNSPDFGKTNFNPIGGHTLNNFLKISDISDLDNLSPSDYKFLIFDPNTPGLPPEMAKYSSSVKAGGHIEHQELFVWNPNAQSGKYSFGRKIFKRVAIKTQINPLWSEDKIKEEYAYAISNMASNGPPDSPIGPFYQQTGLKTSQGYIGYFTDGTAVKIKKVNYEWQNGKLYIDYISYMEIKY